jgi:predicted HTH transcriptional regulator
MKDDDRLSLDETAKYLMERLGVTRKEAETRILQALKSGKLKATGVRPGLSEADREPIPTAVFQSIPTEH